MVVLYSYAAPDMPSATRHRPDRLDPSNHLCSPSGFPPIKRSGTVFFIAAGTRDSVVISPDGSGEGLKGQRFLAFRIGGDVRDMAQANSGSQRISIIPRAYSADCHEFDWQGPSIWARPGLLGFFVAERRRGARPGSKPVFYAPFASFQPFSKNAPDVTPEQYFDFYEAMPSLELIRRNPDAAVTTILKWKQRHSRLASQLTLKAYLSILEDVIELARNDQLPPPDPAGLTPWESL
jgi:hypothetical protein